MDWESQDIGSTPNIYFWMGAWVAPIYPLMQIVWLIDWCIFINRIALVLDSYRIYDYNLYSYSLSRTLTLFKYFFFQKTGEFLWESTCKFFLAELSTFLLLVKVLKFLNYFNVLKIFLDLHEFFYVLLFSIFLFSSSHHPSLSSISPLLTTISSKIGLVRFLSLRVSHRYQDCPQLWLGLHESSIQSLWSFYLLSKISPILDILSKIWSHQRIILVESCV